jgi:glucokinase-like ROK family protein
MIAIFANDKKPMGKKDILKADSEVMNKINRRVILQLIRKNHSISRAELVKLTGLAAPTVSRIVDKLVNDEKLAIYKGIGHSNGGRPPVMVDFNSSDKYVLGIDLGATLIRGVLADLDAEILMEIQLPTGKEEGYHSVINNLVDVVERLMSRRGLDSDSVIGLGVGVAGLLDKKKKVLNFSPDFGWRNVEFKKDIEAKVKVPVFVENSTRLMALGEKAYGQGKDLENFIVVNVGYGIAAGLVVGGQVVDGGYGYSGEFGHMTIDPDSMVVCDCGRKGCLEALASGRRIGFAAKENLQDTSMLVELSGGNSDRIDAKMVFDAFSSGDSYSKDICIDAICSLSQGLANLIHLLDPTHVFLGGGVSLNGDLFWKTLNKEIREKILLPNRNVQILPTAYKEYSTVVGSLALVLDAVLGLEIR